MAIQNTSYLDVDIKRDNYVDEPKVTQNDAVTFVLRMTDDGVDYPLVGVSTYTLASLRPDGQSVLTVGTLTAPNEITFELGSTEVSVPGNVKAAIQLYDVDGRVSSMPFTYEVTKDIATGYIPSVEEKTLIELVLGQGPAILTAAQAATITANDAAANANAKAALANAEAQEANSAGIYARDKGLLAEQKAALADASANEADTATYNAENATQEAQDATNAINAVLPNVEGLENKGEYNSATTYVKNNLVERNGSSWQALQNTQGNSPPTLPTKSNAYWTLISQRGIDGMGAVSTVNGEGPDVNGNVSITIPDPDLSGLATKTELQALDDEVTPKLSEVISIKNLPAPYVSAIGDGIADDTQAFADARDYLASLTTKKRLVFPSGIYNYTESPNWAMNHVEIIAQGEVRLRYFGTGNAVIFDGGATGNGFDAITFKGGFIIEAPTTAGHGAYIRAIHRSKFEFKVRGAGVNSAGIYLVWGVCSEFDVAVSGNIDGGWYLGAKPKYGIQTAIRNAGEYVSYPTFNNAILEYCITGLYLDNALGCNFNGGTSEGNTSVGVILTETAFANKFNGMDFEVNTDNDIYCLGYENSFNNCDSGTMATFDGYTCKGNLINGGSYSGINLLAPTTGNIVTNTKYNRFNNGRTLTNSNPNNNIFNNKNVGLGIFDGNSKNSFGSSSSMTSLGFSAPNSVSPQIDLPAINGGTGFYFADVTNKTGYPEAYGSIFGFSLSSNDWKYSWQIFHGFNAGTMKRRVATSATTWGPFKTISEV